MFDWTAEITGTGDRSEYKLENYQKVVFFGVINKDVVTEALDRAIVTMEGEQATAPKPLHGTIFNDLA